VPARARLTAEVVAELARLQSAVADARLGNRAPYSATLAVGASVADWAMQGEPWCVEAAREIRELSQEVLALRRTAMPARLPWCPRERSCLCQLSTGAAQTRSRARQPAKKVCAMSSEANLEAVLFV